MKKFFSYFMIFMCLLGTSVVMSCSSSDDEEEDKLPDLQYLNDAAIYQLQDNKDMISYVELTTAGNYFIQYLTMAPSSSSAIANFEFGSYTKNSDGSYQLNQKNTTLKINGNTITIGDDTYTATKVGLKASFADASKICRTWRTKKVSANISSSVLKPIEVSASNYKDLENKIDQNGYKLPYFEKIDYVCFSNTYMYGDHLSYIAKVDNTIARKVWQWKNGKVNLNDESQDITVTFEGSTMKFSHTTIDGSTTIQWVYEFNPLQSNSLR